MRWTFKIFRQFSVFLSIAAGLSAAHASAGSSSVPIDRRSLESDTAATQPAERIAIGDKLRVVVGDLQSPGADTVTTPLVDQHGKIAVRYIHAIAVKGLTAREAELAIVAAYHDANLLAKGEISVTWVEHAHP